MKVTLIRGRGIEPGINKIAKALATHGYSVKLLIWDRDRTAEPYNAALYSTYKCTIRAPYDRPAALLYLPLWWAYELVFLLRDDSDVIHASDFDTLFPAILAKLIGKRKLCYFIYDFYADNLPDGGFQGLRKGIRWFVAYLERTGIGFADVLFLVDESRFEEVDGAHIKKLYYVYNSPIDWVAKLHARTSGTASGGSPDEMVIFYAGAMHGSRGLNYMFDAVSRVEGVRLKVAGPITDNERVLDELNRVGSKAQYLGFLPSYDDVIRETLKADLLFRFNDPKVPKTKYESPYKLFEAMMCEKPIIVSDESAMANIVRKEQCGVVVPYGDVPALTHALKTCREDPQLRAELGKNGRKAYEERYSWVIMEERVLSGYHSLDQLARAV
jgi:glycosyltransferase involved in cell wall biosynthesis